MLTSKKIGDKISSLRTASHVTLIHNLLYEIRDGAYSPSHMVKFFWAMMNISCHRECSRCIGHIATPFTVSINVFGSSLTSFEMLRGWNGPILWLPSFVEESKVSFGPHDHNARQLESMLAHDEIVAKAFSRWHGMVSGHRMDSRMCTAL